MKAKATRSASELLVIWGLYLEAGRFDHVLHQDPTGNPEQEDDEQLAAMYVQTTPGYFKAFPVLRHVHVRHHPAASFDPVMPGETLTDALRRLEWPKLEGLPVKVIGPTIYEEFLSALEAKCKASPFVYWQEVEDVVVPLKPRMAMA